MTLGFIIVDKMTLSTYRKFNVSIGLTKSLQHSECEASL